jgi:pimeloyl-ACP methyl ester carboxylesterase
MKHSMLSKLAFMALFTFVLSTACHAQSPLAGDWQGALNAGGAQFRIAWHVIAAKDGSLTSTLDNIDQGIFGIKVKSLTLDGSRLTLTIDDEIEVNGQSMNVKGVFDGTIDKDATDLKGTWTQTEPEQAPAELNLKHEPAQAAAKPAVASDIDGTWLGTLDAGATKLRLVLKIANSSDGLTASLQSPDQSPQWLPASLVTRSGDSLTVEFKPIGAVYTGKIGVDLGSIDGTFTQSGVPLPLVVKRATGQSEAEFRSPKPPVKPSDIDGMWLGTLDAGAVKLRLVLKIVNGPDGLGASLQSPDQGPQWMPVTSVTRNGGSLTFEIKSLGVVFEGKIGADLNSVEGTFTQGGRPLPLALKRVKDQAELETRHPQNPVKPYPYHEEEVTYANKAAGNMLAGTVTIPAGKGPFPAVLLISGSGPNDRDETVFGHKPFLVLSDYLTRKGILVLRADKRGIGKSTGDLIKATTADFATDAEAGVAYLKTRAEVDPHRIGLIGHSEGGTVAPMVAAGDPGVRFIVLMAGPGVPGDQIIVEQGRLIEEAAGETKEKAAQDADRQRAIFALVETEKDDAVLEKELREKLAGRVPDGQIDVAIQQVTSPWMRYTLTYDPATALRKVACPVLALNGEKDLQVSSAQNLPAIRKALEEGGNKHAEIDEMPGLNHLFQTAKTGSPTEYAQSEETISPVALDKIAGWILKQ